MGELMRISPLWDTVPGSPLLFNVQPEKGTHKPGPSPKAPFTPPVAVDGAHQQAFPELLVHMGVSGAPEESEPNS